MEKQGNLLILVVDDQELNRRMLDAKLNELGHRVIFANDGVEGVEMFKQHAPDMILMDGMMPNKDGFQAAAEIRELETEYRTPIIFLSAMNDKESIIKGLTIGDDYIAKPISFDILEVKIDSLSRFISAQKTVKDDKEKIETMFSTLDTENKIAVHVMKNLSKNQEENPDDSIQRIVIPAGDFSGDIILSKNTPEGRTNFLLADAVGHGLPAAINMIPVTQTFGGMSSKGIPLSVIARELNSKIKELMPIDRFVCCILLSVDFANGEMEIWNAGCPSVIWADENGNIVDSLRSDHPPLGLISDSSENFETTRFVVSPKDQIFAFSDGVSEGLDDDSGECGILAGLLAGFAADDRFDAIIDAVLSCGQKDDISLLSLRFPEQFSEPCDNDSDESLMKASFTVEHSQIRDDGLPSRLFKSFEESGICDGCDAFQEVFSALFLFAKKYGIQRLPLDAEDTTATGDREITKGSIKIDATRVMHGKERHVRLSVSDSGKGHPPAVVIRHPEMKAIEHLAKVTVSRGGTEFIANIPITF